MGEEQYIKPGASNNQTIAPLFSGLFFRDRRALTAAQKKVFESMTPQEWDAVREKIYHQEKRTRDMLKRYQISEGDENRLRIAAALRAPPPYKEMRKLLGLG
ncbi:MAG: hypothetical protein N3F05_04840 [Candidatus Diapherotrites archaeon]|nr:hypothetical protein [Candidatus Diapherotrites archaeon]